VIEALHFKVLQKLPHKDLHELHDWYGMDISHPHTLQKLTGIACKIFPILCNFSASHMPISWLNFTSPWGFDGHPDKWNFPMPLKCYVGKLHHQIHFSTFHGFRSHFIQVKEKSDANNIICLQNLTLICNKNNKLHKDVEEITHVLIWGTIVQLDYRNWQKPQNPYFLRYNSIQSHLCFPRDTSTKIMLSTTKNVYSLEIYCHFREQQYTYVLKVYDEHFHLSS
jgi:hypothetical protein